VDNIFRSGSPLCSKGNWVSISISIRRQGFWERSARFLSCQITRRKSSSCKVVPLAADTALAGRGLKCGLVLERRTFMDFLRLFACFRNNCH
jgi:hypothetical protein